MPVPTKTYYPALSDGYPEASRTDVSIVGLDLQVFGLAEIESNDLPIACVIATHGRGNNATQMAHFAQGILGRAVGLASGKAKKREAIVVTLDQRNHGTRMVDPKANLAYDENPRHLYDMAATVVGGCHDVSLIIDFLAAYLFPHGERVIEEFIPTGVSLGGNVTWRLTRYEPRVSISIPIIGLPFEAFARYLGARAEKMGLAFAPPLYPPSLKPIFDDPVPPDAYRGKKILSLHGEVDTLVPIALGRAELDRIAQNDDVEVWAQPGAGHVVTVEMMDKAAEWIWRWAMS